MNWQPMEDQVFIERLEPIDEPVKGLILTDIKADGKMLLRRGRVLATGPGKWVEGTWWKRGGQWEWIGGYRERLEVRAGDLVLFNARWNDLCHAENRGSGADGKGPMERPLSYRFDPRVHLVQEADIAGKIA